VALQPSPPAHRLIDLVEFLARHPGDEFTVSEIARGAGLNRTTCTSLLLALQARGWVRPRGRATFTLGSALIPLGEAALAGLDVAVEVQPELDALVADLGMEALASVVSGHEIIVVGHARTASVLSSTVRVGQTIPLSRRSASPTSYMRTSRGSTTGSIGRVRRSPPPIVPSSGR
jgi:DNA-binding IclR family transcriptional regulator